MGEGSLPPEACVDLKIKLDRLNRIQERCRDGLARLAEGALTKSEYVAMVREQLNAQKAWEERHRKYFVESGEG